MAWEDCDVIERVPDKMNGEPVIKGTRVLAETIVSNFESGSTVEEIASNYPHVPVNSIRKIDKTMEEIVDRWTRPKRTHERQSKLFDIEMVEAAGVELLQ